MTNIASATVRFQADQDTIRRRLDEIQTDRKLDRGPDSRITFSSVLRRIAQSRPPA